jgi:hypothetical protein
MVPNKTSCCNYFWTSNFFFMHDILDTAVRDILTKVITFMFLSEPENLFTHFYQHRTSIKI